MKLKSNVGFVLSGLYVFVAVTFFFGNVPCTGLECFPVALPAIPWIWIIVVVFEETLNEIPELFYPLVYYLVCWFSYATNAIILYFIGYGVERLFNREGRSSLQSQPHQSKNSKRKAQSVKLF